MTKWIIGLAVAVWASAAVAQFYGHQAPTGRASNDEPVDPNAAESPLKYPAAPNEAGLVSFFVSAGSPHRFMVDADSVSVEKEGVVRYTLVIQASGGARNVSYEGMRCATAERRTYAFGKADGSWSPTRTSGWSKIREAEVNRQHAALYQEYFCPGGVIVRSVDEVRRLLRAGGEKQHGTPGR